MTGLILTLILLASIFCGPLFLAIICSPFMLVFYGAEAVAEWLEGHGRKRGKAPRAANLVRQGSRRMEEIRARNQVPVASTTAAPPAVPPSGRQV